MTKPAKTLFKAVSPVTGATATRKSLHAYTHCAFTVESNASLVAAARKGAVDQRGQAAEYATRAAKLRSGRTDADDARGMNLFGEDITQYALRYERYAAEAVQAALELDARAAALVAAGTISESATFHHSEALARKALSTGWRANHAGHVVVAEPV